MLRKSLLALAVLLSADVATTAAAPVLGASLTAEAHAADFTGRIKRVRIKKTRAGSSFKVSVKTTDDGDGSVNTIASIGISIYDDGSVLGDDGVATATLDGGSDSRVFRSSLFSFDGASPPEGEYRLLTDIYNADGKIIGEQQEWLITADGTDSSVEAQDKVASSVYVSEVEMTSDECGNARLKAKVEGDDAELAASLDLTFEEPFEGPAPLETTIHGNFRRAGNAFNNTDVDLGAAWGKVSELEEHAVIITVTAYDAKGNTLGSTKTEATAKYGDILIDGVPLEFD